MFNCERLKIGQKKSSKNLSKLQHSYRKFKKALEKQFELRCTRMTKKKQRVISVLRSFIPLQVDGKLKNNMIRASAFQSSLRQHSVTKNEGRKKTAVQLFKC